MSEIISNTKEQFGEISLRKTGKKIVLALQHLIAMFGSTVLVPILTGLDISVALFCAGIGTLIFHICTKMKVPVFLGSSFAFIPVICAVKVSYGDLRYAQGGIMIAGLIYVLMSFIIKKSVLKNKSCITSTGCWAYDYGNRIKLNSYSL